MNTECDVDITGISIETRAKDIKFNVDITDIIFETPPMDSRPSLARIELTINGMPATLCPFIMPGKDQSLELYSRSPVQEAWGAHRHAWKSEILPALEKHMQAHWDEEDVQVVTAAVNNAVYAVCSSWLKHTDRRKYMHATPGQILTSKFLGDLINTGCIKGIDVKWQDEYELDTPEQQQAADILTEQRHMDIGGIQLSVDHGHAITSIRSIPITRNPITNIMARRVIGTWNELCAAQCSTTDKLMTLMSIVSSAH